MSTKEKLKYVEAAIAALLKLEGFKKERLTWRRQTGRKTHIVNIQVSVWSTKEKKSFQVHLGVFDADAFENKYGRKITKPNKELCQKRQVIANLREHRRLYEITESTDEKEMAAELVADLKAYGLPWLEN